LISILILKAVSTPLPLLLQPVLLPYLAPSNCNITVGAQDGPRAQPKRLEQKQKHSFLQHPEEGTNGYGKEDK
jgi:hypothetical protein